MSKGKLQREIGYCCSYTPVEILHSFGLEPRYCMGSPSAPDTADAYLNSNICGFVKAVARSARNGLRDMVFADSCDAMVKLWEAWNLHSDFEDAFSYLLPFPRVVNEDAIQFWQNALQHLIGRLAKATGREFRQADLADSINKYNQLRSGLRQAEEILLADKLKGSTFIEVLTTVQQQDLDEAIKTVASFREAHSNPHDEASEYRLLITGSNFPALSEIASLLEENASNAVFLDTCNANRSYCMVVDESLPPLEAISRGYLQKTPCPRMQHSVERLEQLVELVKTNSIDGVIYHTLKFCDLHNMDYLMVKKRLEKRGIPLLRVETEHEFTLPGQMRTRVEAFLEML